MKQLLSMLATSCALATLIGCASQPLAVDAFSTRRFEAPLNTRLSVNTGDAFYVSGTYIEGERIHLESPQKMMIPGSMFIPFPVEIQSGFLELGGIKGRHKYFCAQEGRASASFPGLGSVIRAGDCVGIRVGLDDGKPEWVVDNSVYNRGMDTIWTKAMSEAEAAKYQSEKSPVPFKVRDLKRLVFDGFHGDQLHFTWEEMDGKTTQSRQFKFDFKGLPKVLGIKGNQFKVFAADDVKLDYEWVKFD